MSATGATDYRDGGAYYTPLPVASTMVGRWAQMFRAYPAAGRHPGRLLRTLDASAGGGAYPIALHRHGLVEPGSLPHCYRPPPCDVCAGTGRNGKSGGDATAYASFLWDHQHVGAPTIGWLDV